ncbi:MAG: cupin domain-containing protein [Pirellulaceae bacterium]
MAKVHIPDQSREITDVQEMAQFLEPFGIWYEKWDVEGRIGPDATDAEILEAYDSEIEQLKERGGFVTADVINVKPSTPGLDTMLEKFKKEHTHSEDEIRFTVYGSGVFHVNPENGPVFSITVESGDMVNVPRGTKHWFNLCDDRTIRCIRLFEDMSGWAPHYIEDGVHSNYAPLCMGPGYLQSGDRPEFKSVIE